MAENQCLDGFCRSWRHLDADSINAMIIAFLLLLASLFVAFMAVYIDNDGHGRMPAFRHPPRSHEADAFERRSLV
jgi:hypothetical protein